LALLAQMPQPMAEGAQVLVAEAGGNRRHVVGPRSTAGVVGGICSSSYLSPTGGIGARSIGRMPERVNKHNEGILFEIHAVRRGRRHAPLCSEAFAISNDCCMVF
jgi:hypothetical protein